MDVVGKVNLLAANATTDLAFAFVRVFGTLLAGFLATFSGVGLHFMLTTFAGIPTLGSNGLLFMLITFTGVAAVLLLRRIRDVEPQIRTDLASPVEDLNAGLRYVASNPIVWTLLILGSVVEVFGWNYRQALLERAFDLRKIYRASWRFVGLAAGLGAPVSLLFLSIHKDIKSQSRLMMVAYIFMAVSVMIFAWSLWLVLSAALMAIAYFMRTSSYAIMDTLLQNRVSRAMRVRVLGLQFVLVGFSNARVLQTWSTTGQPHRISLGATGGWVFWMGTALLGAPITVAFGPGIVAVVGLIMLRGVSAIFR